MTDRTQFEAMLEALINEDQETAKEIFHNIVVAKSREIYEELLAEDFDDIEERTDDNENPMDTDEGFPSEEDDEEPADDAEDDEEGDEEGDATDDFAADDEEGDEEGSDMEDRVMDLEDALDELKAEFEELMAGEEGEEQGDMDAMGDMDPMGDMDADELEMEDPMMDPTMVAEYVNKVSLPKHGDNGVNTRSSVAGKNNMGGTTANIAKSFSTEKGGTQGGLLKPTTTLQDGGNINKPGATAGKSAFKKKETAKHGDNGDRGADSLINGVKSRAK